MSRIKQLLAPLHHTLILLAAAVFVGCALPGPLRPVGGQMVEGVLLDVQGVRVAGEPITLVQGHFDELDSDTVHYLSSDNQESSVERQVVYADTTGRFSHKFKGFAHCHPIWLIPPVLTLPARMTGDLRHGSFFLMKTPGPTGQIYEVTTGEKPAIRVFDRRLKTARKPQWRNMPEEITVASETLQSETRSSYTRFVRRVSLSIHRKLADVPTK